MLDEPSPGYHNRIGYKGQLQARLQLLEQFVAPSHLLIARPHALHGLPGRGIEPP